MPLAFDPNCVVEFTFPADEALPENERPRYLARALTCRQEHEVDALLKQAFRESDSERRDTLFNAALGLVLVGWRNLRDAEGKDIPFAVVEREIEGVKRKCVEAWDGIYTRNEKVIRLGRLTDTLSDAEWSEKKALLLPSASATASCAGTATAAVAAGK